MTSRVISYVFRGDFGNMKSGLAGLSHETDVSKRKLTELEAQAKKSQANVAGFGKGVAGSLGVGFASGGAAIGLAAAAGIAAVVSTTAKFDQSMSAVQAATHETAGNMKQLREAALDAGKATVFSASESANAIEELAKAGVSTTDILGGGLSGALDLAAAGALSVADAASIAATAMTQFGLSGEQVPHIADLLAAGAGKAQGSVQDLGMALNQSGLVAAQMGLSIEETTGTLAAFASAGLIGSDAGTSFKTMLLRLANPSAEAAKLMRSLGIAAYDINGNFVGTTKLAGQLQGALKGQSQASRDAALATIFGSDAIRAANVLYTDGAQGISDWTGKVNDAGYAAETASIRLDNLSGDFEQLKGSIETAFIQSGEGSQSLLRTLTQTATEFVNLGGPAEEMGQGIVKQITNVDGLSASLKQLGGWFGTSGGEAKKAKAPTEEYGHAVANVGSSAFSAGADIESLAKSMTEQRKAALSAFDAVTQYGQALDDARKRAKESNDGIKASTKAGRENRDALSKLAAAWNNQSEAVRNNSSKFRQARRDFIETATAMGVPIGQARRLAKSLLEIPNSTIVTVDARTSPAEAAIAAIKRQLASVPRSVRTDYYVNQVNGINKRGQHADGGYIAGPGTATSDSIPAYLSNGEYVVRAASVAKYGVAMFDSLNAGHFANGGMAGGSALNRPGSAGIAATFGIDIDPDDSLKKRLRLFGNALEDAKTRLQDEVSARDSLIGTIKGNLTGDLFGASGGSAFSSKYAAGSVGDVNGRLRQQIRDANQQTALEKQLRARGLSGAALQELIASGGVSALRSFASSSNADLRTYQSLYNQRSTAVDTAALAGASVLGMTSAQNKTAAQVAELNATVKRLEKQLARQHDDSKKDRAKNARATGDHVAKAHDKSAKNARSR